MPEGNPTAQQGTTPDGLAWSTSVACCPLVLGLHTSRSSVHSSTCLWFPMAALLQVHKSSKFIHGTAVLFPDMVQVGDLPLCLYIHRMLFRPWGGVVDRLVVWAGGC